MALYKEGDSVVPQAQAAYSVIAELRTTLLEVDLLAQTDGAPNIPEVTKPAIQLCDGFLFAQDLDEQTALELSPTSLSATVEDILHGLSPLARLYDVDLELTTTRSRVVAALPKQAFKHATHGLLYSAISSLQNDCGSKLTIKTACYKQPYLSIFGSDLDFVRKDIHSSRRLNKLKPTLMSCGLQSGLILADELYRRMGSRLSFSANQHGKGFLVGFAATKQMALV